MKNDLVPASLDPQIGGNLLEAAGTPGFGDMFLAAAQSMAGVEEVFAYRVAPAAAPETLISSSSLGDAALRAAWYARRFHQYDPAARARDALAVGEGFMHHVRCDEIAPSDYRAICFERPRFGAKLCYGWRTDSHSFVISFYRQGTPDLAGGFRLAALANMGMAILMRQSNRAPVADRIDRRLKRLFPQLSARERLICAQTLVGRTADQIAADLDIRRSTVLTYRQRAYQRLGFSGAADFLDTLLD